MQNQFMLMFTGIIEATTKVKHLSVKEPGATLVLEKPRGWRLKKGESIAVNGVCLTVVGLTGGIHFTHMPETAARSTIGKLSVGETVNLERPRRVGDRLDGHIVQGHVDTVGTIAAVTNEGNSHILKIVPRDARLLRFMVEKGSVAIEGISLTVVNVTKTFFTVNIIPHTWEATNLSNKKPGAEVNLEADMLAKYLEKLYAIKK